MKRKLASTSICVVIAAVCTAQYLAADEPPAKPEPLRPSQQTALRAVEERRREIAAVNRAIWEFAEVGLEEKKSSALLVAQLKEAGFDVKTGVADMPTAFVATYGSGKPIIGILAEYDALPGLSQKVSPEREPVDEGAPGHGCGHSGLGAGALGAALAVKAAMEEHRLPGTIRLYGTPAEETVIGKVYMLLGGEFKDLDVCLHWHPAARNEAWSGSSKAVVSVKFTFTGTAAHAAGSPDSGRSALDAVELMNIGVNYMREHVKEDARFHYVITDGGGAPNVVPATATVWYYLRADDHKDVESYYKWVNDIARGAALMTQTKLAVQVETDCHELIPNTPLSELLVKSLTAVGAPTFTDEERAFARRLQQPLIEEFGTQFPLAIDEGIHPLSSSSDPAKGSTDVGDISWFVPTGGLRTTCMVAKSPGHSWQNVATIGSTIGEKGTIYAAKVLAITAIDLLEKPELIAAAKSDWQTRMKDREYTTLVPKGQKAPVKIR
jgi:aminobenzoyl-glutamate utilization protein B